MKKFPILSFALILMLAGVAKAQDSVTRSSGPPQAGQITGSDAQGVRISVVLSPDQPPASMVFSYATIREVKFGNAAQISEFLRTATPDKLAAINTLWQQRQGMLAIPGSQAGEIGLALGDLWVKSDAAAQHQAALSLFEKVAASDPDPTEKARAAEGRLRALISVGRAAEAVEDAKNLASSSENPETLIQAKYILAEASFTQLKKLIEDNPKWTEDVLIRPERNRLYHETLDLYLFPSLFYGAETEPAARGLWGAIQVCQLGNELASAREMARDLEILYPGTTYAAQAKAFVQTLPADLQK